MAKPTCIAICGYPRAGKSTLQDILEQSFGVLPFDDALVIREAAMAVYGLDLERVSTQAGKASAISVGGRSFTVRELLGQLGNFLIDAHGTQFKPQAALRRAREFARERELVAPVFSFASVRLDEARSYSDAGGLVVEVRRPGCSASRPEDDFDRSLVDLILHNDGTLDAFRAAISSEFTPIFAQDPT